MKDATTINRKEGLILIAAQIVMLCSLSSIYPLKIHFEELYLTRLESPVGQLLSITLLALLIAQVMLLLYFLVLYIGYRETKSVFNRDLPNCTIIVPAYNEGKLVYSTLLSIAKSNYPKDKMEIIAVDDGSIDDTYSWIQRANMELGGVVKVFKLAVNSGKREALYRGFKSGNGDVFVTIDSDSIIKSNTLRNLVSPFVTDCNCGAVAGNVKVLNRDKSTIPRMLSVSFLFSFEFIRAAQSS